MDISDTGNCIFMPDRITCSLRIELATGVCGSPSHKDSSLILSKSCMSRLIDGENTCSVHYSRILMITIVTVFMIDCFCFSTFSELTCTVL